VAVGGATATALEKVGLRVDLVPRPAVAESIVAAIRDQVRGQRVLLIRAEVARDLLPVALEQAGAQITTVDAYRTMPAEESVALVSATFGQPDQFSRQQRIDALTFTSSSTVSNLDALLHKAGVVWPAAAKAFSIGPITSSTLREHGIEPCLEAAQHDVEGLIQVVLRGLTDLEGEA
jgi:uroporphyrinogen-III synthase